MSLSQWKRHLKKKFKRRLKKVLKNRADAKSLKKKMQKIEDEAYKEALREKAVIEAKARGKAKALERAKGGSSFQEKLNTVARGFQKVQKKAAELERSGFGRVNLFNTKVFGTDLLGLNELMRKKKTKRRK